MTGFLTNMSSNNVLIVESKKTLYLRVKDLATTLGLSKIRNVVNKQYQNFSAILKKEDIDNVLSGDINTIYRTGELFINQQGFIQYVFKSRSKVAVFYQNYLSELFVSYTKQELLDRDSVVDVVKKITQDVLNEYGLNKKVSIEDNADINNKLLENVKGIIDLGKVAKVLNFKDLGRNKLFGILREANVLNINNIPYQRFIDAGYFKVIPEKYITRDGEEKTYYKTYVTQKGVVWLKKNLVRSRA